MIRVFREPLDQPASPAVKADPRCGEGPQQLGEGQVPGRRPVEDGSYLLGQDFQASLHSIHGPVSGRGENLGHAPGLAHGVGGRLDPTGRISGIAPQWGPDHHAGGMTGDRGSKEMEGSHV
jgi:hypothetical protein